MRITRLQLENFRGFSKLDLALPENGLAVLIGENGAGKSSLLYGIHLLIERSISNKPSQFMLARDMSIGADEGSLGLSFNDGQVGHIAFRFSKTITEPPRPHLDGNTYEGSYIFLYLSIGRFFSEDLAVFLEWFRREENLENELRLRQDPNHRNPRLEVVRRGLSVFLQRLSPHGEYINLRFSRVHYTGDRLLATDGTFVLDKNSQTLAIDQLSDGERVLLLTVGDIARRLAIANPDLSEPLEGEGVVLIDEIELHLHPAWQRQVIPALRAAFPNLQFIATTHSPQVLSNVPQESVILLENFQAYPGVAPTYGRDSNAILTEVMGVPERPEHTRAKLAEITQLIDAENFAAAKERLRALAEQLGEQDAEVVRNQALIDFLAS